MKIKIAFYVKNFLLKQLGRPLLYTVTGRESQDFNSLRTIEGSFQLSLFRR